MSALNPIEQWMVRFCSKWIKLPNCRVHVDQISYNPSRSCTLEWCGPSTGWHKFGELIEDLYRKGFELLSEKDNCWFRNYRWIHYLLKNDSWRLIELGCTNLAPVRINLLYRQSFMKRKNKWRNPSTRWMEWLPKPIQLVWRRSQSDEVKLKTHGVRLFL